MDWIIKSKDGENTYPTEDGFRAALTDIFNDAEKQFVSATKPDGTVLDETSAKALVEFTIGVSAIGDTPIG